MGFNEVVMLRRLPERHKLNALDLLRGDGKGEKYDGLYGLPHADVRELLLWTLLIRLYSPLSQHLLILFSIVWSREARLADLGCN